MNNKRCAWCDAILMGNETRGDVCNDCLSGETACEGCGRPLREHEGACDDGEPFCPDPADEQAICQTCQGNGVLLRETASEEDGIVYYVQYYDGPCPDCGAA